MKNNEILDIVEKLQWEIYDKSDECEYYFLEAIFCSGTFLIQFLSITIWNSEDDTREYNEETHEYEPLEQYLRREINKEIKRINKIKL